MVGERAFTQASEHLALLAPLLSSCVALAVSSSCWASVSKTSGFGEGGHRGLHGNGKKIQ